MKVVLLALFLVCLVTCNDSMQEQVVELDLAYQVEPAEDTFDYYLDFLKSFFYSDSNGPPLFKQCDSKWANDKMGDKTICQVGCFMSSISMGLNARGTKIDGQAATPKTLNKWMRAHKGYNNNGFIWAAVKPLGLCFSTRLSGSGIDKYVSSSSYVTLLNVHNGGHFVLATGHCSGGWSVNDPGYNVSCYTYGQVTQAIVFKKC